MKRLFAAVAFSAALVPAGALADPNLPSARPHQHFIETPSGNQVRVGPDLCGNPDLEHAWTQFHYNVHRSASSPSTPEATLGPQTGAPGLDDDQGGELIALRC